MKVALICTQGFADVLSLARQNREDPYALHVPPSPWGQLVPREQRLEVAGRIDAKGREVEALGALEVQALAALQPDAVAICLLFGHRNPAHELQVAQRVRDALPGAKVICSHEATASTGHVEALDGEFERTLATLAALGVALPATTATFDDATPHPFVALCDAMQAKLVEAAFSSVVREAMDCAAALFLPDGRLARASPFACRLLLGSLEPAVRGLAAGLPGGHAAPGRWAADQRPMVGGHPPA
jgi:N-methylhydantoinase B